MSTPSSTSYSDLAVPPSQAALSEDLAKILRQAHTGIYDYPLSFTQGIQPKQIYSHNDYWRDVPFWSAISVGCFGMETDVWLYDNELYVGHNPSTLTKERTLDALYIQPLIQLLTRQNPISPFVTKPTRNGVYDKWVDHTLYLVIDMKTGDDEIWKRVLEAVEPLRERGWLSTAEGNTIKSGPVTIIVTGYNLSPLVIRDDINQFKGGSRYVFMEGQFTQLSTTLANTSASIVPMVTGNFRQFFGAGLSSAGLNSTQLETLRSHIKAAHDRGMMLRIYNLPAWPLSTRHAVWRQLVEEGIDLLNVDDIQDAAGLNGVW